VDKRNRRDEVPHSSWDLSFAKSKQGSDTRESPRTAGSALEPISFERGGRWDVWG
jgi:hypothetical protein